jgi:hypothetical protein
MPSLARQLLGKTTLTNPRFTPDEHEPSAARYCVVECTQERCELALPPHEDTAGPTLWSRPGDAARLGSWFRRCRRRREEIERPILPEDRLLEFAELATWLDPQLLNEDVTGVLIGGECFRLAAWAVQRPHQLGTEAFPERMVRHKGLEFTDEISVASERQVCVDARRKGKKPKLLQPRGLALRERLGAKLR